MPEHIEGISVQVIPEADSQGFVKSAEEAAPPALLAGKYKSEEDLNKAIIEAAKKISGGNVDGLVSFYKDLEAKIGQASSTATETKKDTETKPNDNTSAEETINESSPAANNLFESATQEFAEKGQLSDDTYKSLEKAGVPKAVVDAYIEGQKAIAEKQTAELYKEAGGKDNYEKMISWADQALSPADKEAYNKAVTGNDLSVAKLAISGLYAKFTEANGNPPAIHVMGDSPATSSITGYQSQAEVVAAIRDKRYSTDPAYRKQVEQKIAVSKF